MKVVNWAALMVGKKVHWWVWQRVDMLVDKTVGKMVDKMVDWTGWMMAGKLDGSMEILMAGLWDNPMVDVKVVWKAA